MTSNSFIANGEEADTGKRTSRIAYNIRCIARVERVPMAENATLPRVAFGVLWCNVCKHSKSGDLPSWMLRRGLDFQILGFSSDYAPAD